MRSSTARLLVRLGAAALILAALYLARSRPAPEPSTPASPAPSAPPTTSAPSPPPSSAGVDAVRDAFRGRRSNLEVEAGGRVTRVLPDDREGARHERFIVRLGTVSVLVAHNLDLAPRVPVAVGDSIELRGEYEWNAKGGVIHWTHRDPDNRHEAGWIRHRGQLYQ
jgi:hypothetical protein